MRPPLSSPLAAACALLLSLAGPAGAGTAVPTKDQQACLARLGKVVSKVADTQAKRNLACLRAAGKGRLERLGAESLFACTRDDGRGKVAKALSKVDETLAKKCSGAAVPELGVPEAGLAQAAWPARREELGILEDLLSPNLRAAAVACDADAATCRCQQKLLKASDELAAAGRKAYGKCRKRALREGAAPADLVACVDDPAREGSLASAPKPVEKARARLAREASRRCDGLAGHPSPGFCVGLAGDALGACLAERVECRVCFQLRLSEGLDVDCDLVDDGQDNGTCPLLSPLLQETVDLPSEAQPAETPGTAGVTVTNPKLLAQFGGDAFDLNRARYTRFAWRTPPRAQPDAILVLVPGFEGGAGGMKPLAENLVVRSLVEHDQVIEVWAYDRRSNQLEDTLGLDIAEELLDATVALDWLFGDDLAIPLHPALAAGPNRRAEIYDTTGDIPFLANWTPLVFSRDIDAVVEAAAAAAKSGNVFLGGHSAGTGFTARYAATDFDLGGGGPAEPGYAKLRGLVLLEGGGGSTAGGPPSDDALDLVEARFDGGLFGAVRDGEARCVDGTTPCTVATEAADCGALANSKCVEPTGAYAVVAGLLNVHLLASSEPAAIQAMTDPDAGLIVLQVDQGGVAGNNAVAQVPELGGLVVLGSTTAFGGIGSFLDDDGLVAMIASFVQSSLGAPGPTVNDLITWQDLDESTLFDPTVVPDLGPPDPDVPDRWGREREVVRLERVRSSFFAGQTNFVDWYFPSSGLSVTSGLPTLDSTALSVGRGRRDIENLTQAAAIDVPVIALGGSNGLTPVPSSFLAFAQSIGPCAAPSCDGTPRVVDPSMPTATFPTFGGVAGGYEVHISEGYAHVDVIAAEDLPGDEVVAPLAAFLARNSQ